MRRVKCPKCGMETIHLFEVKTDPAQVPECFGCIAREKGSGQMLSAMAEVIRKKGQHPGTSFIGKLMAKILTKAASAGSSVQQQQHRIKLKRTVIRPENIKVNRIAGGMEIFFERPGYKGGTILTWAIFMLPTGALAYLLHTEGHTRTGLLIAICVALALFILSSSFKGTQLKIDKNHLAVDHYPINLFKKRIRIEDIQQLYCRQGMDMDGPAPYGLFVRPRAGADIELFSTYHYDSVRYIEQEIEKALGITDVEIADEA